MMHSHFHILISTPRIKLSIDRRSPLIRTIKNKKNAVEALVELSMVISKKTLLQMITVEALVELSMEISNKMLLQMITVSEGLHRKERIKIRKNE